MKIAILCGGKGTRLGLTDRPKSMVDVAGMPLLERLIDHGRGCGFDQFVLLTGHLSDYIEQYFGDGRRFGVSITYACEQEPLGTGGALLAAREHLREPFVVLYGDLLLDVDLAHMAACHVEARAMATLFVHPNDHPHDSDLVEIDDAGRIRRFMSKPHAPGAALPNLVNGAIYVLDPAALDFVDTDRSSDWGHDVFPLMLEAGVMLQSYKSFEYAKDIGTPDRLAHGVADLTEGRVAARRRQRTKPAIMLDRDGVLNHEIGGVHYPDGLKLLPGVAASVRRINERGIPAICVTNQPDLAKGLMSLDDFRRISSALDTQLATERAYLDELYYCPHHPEGGWPGERAELKLACACRKPQPGLLLRAAKDFNLDLARSWMVGDRYADIAAARAAGTHAVLVRTGHAGNDLAGYDCVPDAIVADLPEAVDLILATMR